MLSISVINEPFKYESVRGDIELAYRLKCRVEVLICVSVNKFLTCLKYCRFIAQLCYNIGIACFNIWSIFCSECRSSDDIGRPYKYS